MEILLALAAAVSYGVSDSPRSVITSTNRAANGTDPTSYPLNSLVA
jgi:hypothetical protein